MNKLHVLIAVCVLSIQSVQATETELDGSVLLRYENETDQINLTPRKRVRVIAAIGVTSQLNDVWSFTAQARTGLKNKQNVPAFTLYQITDQPAGDKDIYISRAFAKAKFDSLTMFAGKIPWKTNQVTDLFWDRHLNPIGVHLDYDLGAGQNLKFTSFKPLDGASGTVGHMSIFQYQSVFSTDLGKLTVSPWFVDYRGQTGALYAKKDTLFDNQFVRLSMKIKQGNWQLGTDIGWSIKDTPIELGDAFSKQKLSYAIELKQGDLKTNGNYLTQLRYLHVERFSVVTEFAQNASSRFATSNFKGWDLRIRHKVSKNLWVGGRISRTQRLVGTPEQSVRFRLETKYTF
ncbi:putative porin [Aliiglaciecola lipolytica]|uniref:putative porin n=1 Tax=Aliiglaciecola lipolytica TaxID=477689 RepID=UPI001C09706F|nr:putative porin [Aliiglaciecola lipolytica]MBU2879198.1 putative porin [Aliiglaciecola lipolytica]